MTIDRHYQKGNPEIEPLESVAKKNNVTTLSNKYSVSLPNSRYTKPESSKLPKALFVIFSGGTVREKDYFRLISSNPDRFPYVRVAFHAEPNFDEGGKPSIIRFATEKAKDYIESASKENADHYYLITDVDHFEQFLPEMKQECNASNIELIISNSCFEIWLYYAEKSESPVDFIIPDKKEEISLSFKKWANSRIEGGVKPTKAIFKIEENIINAKSNYSEEKGLPTLFSTQMFRLAEQLLPYVIDGIKYIEKENEKKRLANKNID